MRFLLTFIFLFLFSFQIQANWEFISKDKNNSSIYIDIESIKIFKNLIYAWTMFSLNKDDIRIKKTGYSSYITHEYFDCNNLSRATIIELKFHKPMGVGTSFYDSYPDAIINKPQTGSLGYDLVSKACSYMK
tara:strand:+ start:1230 stop:1625 length:396 start_codon:yes stop_codon:yes gene_type:complete